LPKKERKKERKKSKLMKTEGEYLGALWVLGMQSTPRKAVD